MARAIYRIVINRNAVLPFWHNRKTEEAGYCFDVAAGLACKWNLAVENSAKI
jgi:hypothetical protein